MIDEIFQERKYSTFAIFLEYEDTCRVFFSVFHFVLLYFVPYECPGVCRHRPGDSLGKILKYHEMENDKKYIVNGFS